MKKRILCLGLALVLAASCFGCNKTDDDTGSNDKKPDNEVTTEVPKDQNEGATTEEQTTEEPTKKPTQPQNIVESGCTYYDASTNITLKEGDELPNIVEDGDIYTTSDYIYTYASYKKGWKVEVIDTTKTNYEEILSSIAGVSVTSLVSTFRDCTNLISAPEIPSSVIDMAGAFIRCTSLTNAPEIPSGVKDMTMAFQDCTSLTNVLEIPSSVVSIEYTFSGCTSLINAPEIPSSVKYMPWAFEGCTSLNGTIKIEANPISYLECFKSVDFETQNITLTGSSTKLEELRATAK